jgi:hypothetical protein
MGGVVRWLGVGTLAIVMKYPGFITSQENWERIPGNTAKGYHAGLMPLRRKAEPRDHNRPKAAIGKPGEYGNNILHVSTFFQGAFEVTICGLS